MNERFKDWYRDIVQRLGLGGVPTGVVVAALLVAVCAVGWAAWRWWPQTSHAEVAVESIEQAEATETPEGSGAQAEQPSALATAPAEVCVHVAGLVRRPGVYRLPGGSRVVDAVDMAGGPIGEGDTDAINLARRIEDGEQIVVGRRGEPAPGPASSAAGGGTASGASGTGGGPKVNVNTADASALDALPGVGPSTAAKIVAEREQNGPFSSVDDLARVAGIGPKKLEGLADAACVE